MIFHLVNRIMRWLQPSIFGIDDVIIAAGVTAAASAKAQHDANKANQANFNAGMDFNAEQAMYNRDFQATMRATQYQTAVNDLQLAGLNPMLAYTQGGAGTPSGSTANAPGAPDIKPVNYGAITNTAIDVATKKQNLENMQAQKDLLEAQAFQARSAGWAQQNLPQVQEAQASNLKASTGAYDFTNRVAASSASEHDARTTLLQEQTNEVRSNIDLIRQKTESEKHSQYLMDSSRLLNLANEDLARGNITIQEYTRRIEAARASLQEYAQEGGAQDAKFQAAWGQLTRILRGLNPLSGLAR